jgi:peptide/nickel transport system permease protein
VFRIGYLARRAAVLVATLLAVATFHFFLFRVLPGDPIRLMARAGNLTPDAIAKLRAFFGLDQSLPEQYLIYLRNLLTGQFGMSLTYRRPGG